MSFSVDIYKSHGKDDIRDVSKRIRIYMIPPKMCVVQDETCIVISGRAKSYSVILLEV